MTISDKKKGSLKNIKNCTIKKMAEALSDDDTTDSIDSVVPTYREEATDDDGGAGDIINPAKKMRASGLSYEKVKVFSDGKCAEEEAVKYNNFKWTCCKINDTEQGTKKYYICKHIIGLAARYKLCSIPLEAKNIPLGQKRKRGRVAKAKKALIVQ